MWSASPSYLVTLLLIAFFWATPYDPLIWPELSWRSEDSEAEFPLAEVQKQSFSVNVHSVGELEAAHSTVIASSIRGDLGKIIMLVPDGVYVQPNDLLVKMDPTPFEEKIEELKSKINEQLVNLAALKETLKWEKNQAKFELKTAQFESKTAQLELDKIVQGDGPLEIFRLQSAMQKAWVKYEELLSYAGELEEMEQRGFLNPAERRQAEKKLKEEQETYENAKMQYESFIYHVHPMQVKKAETHLRRCCIREDEAKKASLFKIGKSKASLKQAMSHIQELQHQLKQAEEELAMSEIRAPAQGMVVLREEYRTGQKRKPRVGDILVKNQPILDLPDLSQMIVKTKVREVDLFKVQIGKSALLEVDAYPNTFFEGHVLSIGVLALADLGRSGAEKYFEVKIALTKPDERLRPGMTARVTMHSQSVHKKIAVPLPALFEVDKRPCCYVLEGNSFRLRPIEVGAMNEQWVEIKSGLKEHEQVALALPDPGQIF